MSGKIAIQDKIGGIFCKTVNWLTVINLVVVVNGWVYRMPISMFFYSDIMSDHVAVVMEDYPYCIITRLTTLVQEWYCSYHLLPEQTNLFTHARTHACTHTHIMIITIICTLLLWFQILKYKCVAFLLYHFTHPGKGAGFKENGNQSSCTTVCQGCCIQMVQCQQHTMTSQLWTLNYGEPFDINAYQGPSDVKQLLLSYSPWIMVRPSVLLARYFHKEFEVSCTTCY